jgi:hypothetical protein
MVNRFDGGREETSDVRSDKNIRQVRAFGARGLTGRVTAGNWEQRSDFPATHPRPFNMNLNPSLRSSRAEVSKCDVRPCGSSATIELPGVVM